MIGVTEGKAMTRAHHSIRAFKECCFMLSQWMDAILMLNSVEGMKSNHTRKRA